MEEQIEIVRRRGRKKSEVRDAAASAAQAAVLEAVAAPAVKADVVVYVTKEPAVSSFDILVARKNIRGIWDSKRERLTFSVPAELADRFELHTMFADGRIMKA